MKDLSDYEKRQLDAIHAWKSEEPGAVSRAFGVVLAPVAWITEKIVPEAAVRGAIDGASALGEWLADTGDVVRDAQVAEVSDLRSKDLELCDRLANEVHNWAVALAAAEGTATGAFGIFGAPVDIPAIITLALRTIHKVGICYGYQCETEEDQQFVRGILAASGANSMEEKLTALAALTAIRTTLIQQTWKLMAEKAAQGQVSKEAVLVMARNLAKQIGVNLTKRRAAAAIPAIGAAIGGSVNAWYIKEVGWAARRSFQERRLNDQGPSNSDKEAA
jgi:hypothetical protein